MKLRGAISGFGEVAARAHLPGWRTREDLSIVAVHEPVSARRHEALRLIKNVRVYDDLELMLDGEALDFVDIASPPALHAVAARAALKSGAHVIVEKPLCLGLTEFDALAHLARNNSRVLMCVHNWKFAPPYAAAHDAIAAGRLGALRYAALDRFRVEPAGAGGAGAKWRASAETGGGILVDHGWHVFYLMRWLMGDASPVAISARIESGSRARGGGAGQARAAAGVAEDLADLRVVFSDGRLARAHLSWRAPARRTSAILYGDKGMLEIDDDRVTFTGRDGAREDLSRADAPDDSYHSAWFAAMAEAFEHAVAAGPGAAAATANLAEARDVLAMIVAARESAARDGVEIAIAVAG